MPEDFTLGNSLFIYLIKKIFFFGFLITTLANGGVNDR